MNGRPLGPSVARYLERVDNNGTELLREDNVRITGLISTSEYTILFVVREGRLAGPNAREDGLPASPDVVIRT